MAIVLMESFDKYPAPFAGGIGGPSATVNGWVCDENNGGLVTTNPRTGSRHLHSSAGDAVHKSLPASYGEIIHGSGVRFSSLAAGNFFSLRENSGVSHVILAIDVTGHLIAKHGGTGAVYGTSTDAFVASTWYWLEMRCKVHDTTGTVEVRVGGSPWVGPLTGLDTRNGGTGVIEQVHYVGSSFGYSVDDVVVIDPSTGTPTSFIGDSRVECIFPNGNGASSQLLGSDLNTTDNYLLVDEVPHDSDTTYVQSDIVGDKDTYAYPDVSLVFGTVHAVKTTCVARKTSAGTRKFKHVNRLSGGTEEDSVEFSLPDTYTYTESITHTKPGGGAWTNADVNGAEFGVKVSA